jgi:hypothetical protein
MLHIKAVWTGADEIPCDQGWNSGFLPHAQGKWNVVAPGEVTQAIIT